MKVTISNLAWSPTLDEQVFEMLADKGVHEIELAPTKYLPDIGLATDDEMKELRARFDRQRVSIVAMQALLFGKPQLKVFGDETTRRDTLDYLKRVMDLAAILGAGRIIFGSPKNRYIEGMGPAAAQTIALDFFRELGDYGSEKGVMFCIEPNAAAYGCNFMTTSPDAAKFVHDVASRGFRLHLDLGVMRMNNEDIDSVIGENIDIIEHFHVSEPNLKPVTKDSGFDHHAVAKSLRHHGYAGRVSIEMLESPEGAKAVEGALDLVISAYGD